MYPQFRHTPLAYLSFLQLGHILGRIDKAISQFISLSLIASIAFSVRMNCSSRVFKYTVRISLDISVLSVHIWLRNSHERLSKGSRPAIWTTQYGNIEYSIRSLNDKHRSRQNLKSMQWSI